MHKGLQGRFGGHKWDHVPGQPYSPGLFFSSRLSLVPRDVKRRKPGNELVPVDTEEGSYRNKTLRNEPLYRGPNTSDRKSAKYLWRFRSKTNRRVYFVLVSFIYTRWHSNSNALEYFMLSLPYFVGYLQYPYAFYFQGFVPLVRLPAIISIYLLFSLRSCWK